MAPGGPRYCSACAAYTLTEHDESRGHVVCTRCGGVIEESAIVAEVQFMETAKGASMAEGFSLSSTQARVSRKVQGRQTSIRLGENESRETTIANGHRRIQEIAAQPQIRMNERHASAAQRYFNLAVVNNFTKGRKLNNVVAACLYIVCRLEKTAHMLIDFADALSTNVYQIGATFLKLLQLIHVRLPLVDPSLYIQRFANRLALEDKTQAVIKDANRLVARMNRDWIHVGRRPAGICAACLFIASRMNGMKRTYKEIVVVVKICETTLRKRLKDFQETPSSKLTVTEFQNIWLEEAQDPPAYIAGRKRDQTKLKREAEGVELDKNDGDDDYEKYMQEATELSERAALADLLEGVSGIVESERQRAEKANAIPAKKTTLVKRMVKKIVKRKILVPKKDEPVKKLRNTLRAEMDALDEELHKSNDARSKRRRGRSSSRNRNDDTDDEDDNSEEDNALMARGRKGKKVKQDMEEIEVEEEIETEEEVEVTDEEDDDDEENDDEENENGRIKLSGKKVKGEDEDVDKLLMEEIKDLMQQQETKQIMEELDMDPSEDEDANLSELDDDHEVLNMLNITEDEISLRDVIWTEENREWMERQAARRADEARKEVQNKNKRPRVKKVKKIFMPADTPAQAAKLMLDAKPKTSKKINYEVLDSLFDMD